MSGRAGCTKRAASNGQCLFARRAAKQPAGQARKAVSNWLLQSTSVVLRSQYALFSHSPANSFPQHPGNNHKGCAGRRKLVRPRKITNKSHTRRVRNAHPTASRAIDLMLLQHVQPILEGGASWWDRAKSRISRKQDEARHQMLELHLSFQSDLQARRIANSPLRPARGRRFP